MNVIVNAFAFAKEHGNSMQLSGKSDGEKQSIYMKNIVVSLTSAKQQNPKDEVMLVTNANPSEPYYSMLKEAGVVIRLLPYENYCVPKHFAWSLAFYKLCVLDYLSKETEYEKILMMDTDTISMRSYEDIWQEAEYELMLYSVNHAYSHFDRQDVCSYLTKFFPKESGNVVHYGGEFVCAKREKLRDFMEECRSVYDVIMEKVELAAENMGDEVILSLAAMFYKRKHTVCEAGAYIYRYWTHKNFYLISTNTESNPVCIWHLPGEKDRGFLVMYGYFQKHGSYPSAKKAAKMFGIAPAKRPFNLDSLISRMERKKSNLRVKKENRAKK